MPWAIDGTEVTVTEWSYAPLSLDLGLRVHVDDGFVRGLDEHDDGGRTTTFSDGRQEAVTRQGARVLTVTPPAHLQPSLVEDEYLVESYDESAVDAGTHYLDVDLSLQRRETRETDGGYGTQYGDDYGDQYIVMWETGDAAAGEFELRFHNGSIGPPAAHVADGTTDDEVVTLELTLTPPRGEVLLETLGTTAAVGEVPVDDADDYHADNHPDDRNTVRVEPPPSADGRVEPGVYVVSDWSIGRNGAWNRWHASVTAARVAGIEHVAGQYGGGRYGEFQYGDQ